jgi:MOSC domain-containing protein
MPTLPRGDLAADPTLLRTIAQRNQVDLGDFGRLPCAGIYTDVLKPGWIGLGDRIRIGD